MKHYDAVEQARNYLLDKIGATPHIAVIMGSGLTTVDEILRDSQQIHYVTIPNFPRPNVPGHRGRVISGKVGELNVIVFEGRVHYYEGHSMEAVTLCARVIGRMGAKAVLLTNAAGAINPEYQPGKMMLITDHINLQGTSPLIGPNEDRWGPRFTDQSEVYDRGICAKLRDAAQYCGTPLLEGVYASMSGPNYETPAEIRFLRSIGADAVGMSTVPEAIVARHMGLKVGGLSMLTNQAAGLAAKSISHEEVLQTASQMSADVGMLLLRFFEKYVE
jgi:purine-nucleoside phosphorylase